MLDLYGDLSPIARHPEDFGSYALIGPGGFTRHACRRVTCIMLPLDFPAFIFRADKFSPTNENQIKEADAFRRSLMTSVARG